VTAAVQQLRPASADLDTVLANYVAHLARSPLAATSRDAYRKRVAGFLRWLAGQDEHGPEALRDPLAREHALRDYLRHLRVELHRPPTTCNAHLAAVNRLCLWLGLGPSQEKAATLSKTAPRALSETQVRRLLRAAERRGNVRHQAILVLLLATGLRLSELAALDLDDVALSAPGPPWTLGTP